MHSQAFAQASRVGHVLRADASSRIPRTLPPEFGRISLLIQHDLYHHYTIDEHTLKVIEALDELTTARIAVAHICALSSMR